MGQCPPSAHLRHAHGSELHSVQLGGFEMPLEMTLYIQGHLSRYIRERAELELRERLLGPVDLARIGKGCCCRMTPSVLYVIDYEACQEENKGPVLPFALWDGNQVWCLIWAAGFSDCRVAAIECSEHRHTEQCSFGRVLIMETSASCKHSDFGGVSSLTPCHRHSVIGIARLHAHSCKSSSAKMQESGHLPNCALSIVNTFQARSTLLKYSSKGTHP